MAKNVINGTANAVAETINGNLVVTREAIKGKDGKQLVTKDGRLYFSYIVRGIIRGKEMTIDFVPKDKGGYEPLDILFDLSPKAELTMSEEEMTDDKGNVTHYTAYKVQATDEDGEVWDCSVRPQRDSDKTLLRFLLIELKKSKSAVEERAE